MTSDLVSNNNWLTLIFQVHRVLADSVAAKAGLKRGAKVRSINGCAMTGLTHAQSVTILKVTFKIVLFLTFILKEMIMLN